MTPYDKILTKSGISVRKISLDYPQKVFELCKQGFSKNDGLKFDPLDENSINVFEKTLQNTQENIPQWSNLFVDYLNSDIISSFDILGGTPVSIPGVGSVFDLTSAPFPFPPIPIPLVGGESAWTLSVLPLLGPINPLVPPDIDFKTKVSAFGIVLPQTSQTPVETVVVEARITENFPKTRLGDFVFDLGKIPYRMFQKYSVNNLQYVQPTVLFVLNEIIFQDILSEISKNSFLSSINPFPVTLRASLVAWADNISKILTVVVVGSTLGAGNLCKERASTLGLI